MCTFFPQSEYHQVFSQWPTLLARALFKVWGRLLMKPSTFPDLLQLCSTFTRSHGLSASQLSHSFLPAQSSIPEQWPVCSIYKSILWKMLTTEQEEAEANYNIFTLWERVDRNSGYNCLYAMLQQPLPRSFFLQAIWWLYSMCQENHDVVLQESYRAPSSSYKYIQYAYTIDEGLDHQLGLIVDHFACFPAIYNMRYIFVIFLPLCSLNSFLTFLLKNVNE